MTIVERPELLSSVRTGLLGWCDAADGAVLGMPSSRAWTLALQHASLVPGDRVVVIRAGSESFRLAGLARRLGYDVVCIDVGPGQGPSGDELAHLLWWDPSVKAVVMSRDESSAGVEGDVDEVRRGIDLTGSDALLLLDGTASWRVGEVRQQAWSADLVVTGLVGNGRDTATLVSWSRRLAGLSALSVRAAAPSEEVLSSIQRRLDDVRHPSVRTRLQAVAGATMLRLARLRRQRSRFGSPTASG